MPTPASLAAKTIPAYINTAPNAKTKAVARVLRALIDETLPKAESKIWHRTPVWFDDGNPLTGFQLLKNGTVKLMFWSGASFKESGLTNEGGFKVASAVFADVSQMKPAVIKRWLKKAMKIQWDYKNIMKRRGLLLKRLTK